MSKVYRWFLTLQVYIKPEEDALAALKKQKEIEALERAKNMSIDDQTPHLEVQPKGRGKLKNLLKQKRNSVSPGKHSN